MARRKVQHDQGARVFKALGHPDRLRFVEELSRGPRCVSELQRVAGSDVSTVSRHLAVLREAGLVRDERLGNQVFYSLTCLCIRDFLDCVGKVLGWKPERAENGDAPAPVELPDLRDRA